jgi:hypothetical protein
MRLPSTIYKQQQPPQEIKMAEVIGPCATLPGAVHPLPKGTMCDDHSDRVAVARIQGETDSFGAELNDMCAECLKQYNEYKAANPYNSGRCEWCGNHTDDIRQERDFEEGRCGRLYDVCGACRAKESAYVAEEIAAMDRDAPEFDYGDDADEIERENEFYREEMKQWPFRV